MISWIDLHKFADVVFRITKNCFILHHETWSDNTIKELFWTCFVTWWVTGH